MDFSLVASAASAISLAKEYVAAAMSVRDFNESAAVISQVNDQLLRAQDALFRHQSELLALQQKQFETAQELREVKEALAERGRYTLVQIGQGVYVYSTDFGPAPGNVGDPGTTEPAHYVCQSCFDKGVKSVLQREVFYGAVQWKCRVCKEGFATGESVPFSM